LPANSSLVAKDVAGIVLDALDDLAGMPSKEVAL
jgi:hypothetical protein